MLQQTILDQLIRTYPLLTAYTVENGAEYALHTRTVRRYGDWVVEGALQLEQRRLGNTDRTVYAEITLDQFKSFFKFFSRIDKVYTESTYRNVMHNPLWMDMYYVEHREVMFVNKYGDLRVQAESTVPCRECERVLPYHLITIDHQSPQSNGAMSATMRVFRALGLTVGAPSGTKALYHLSRWSQSVGGESLFTDNRNDKQTLTPAGAIYYSVFKNANYVNLLAGECMHHFVNLRPLCSHCNPSKGNRS